MSENKPETEVSQSSNKCCSPKFSVGLNVFFELHTKKDQSLRTQAKIVGWHENTVLITTAPTISGDAPHVSDGSKCIVRYINEGTAYGFPTVLLGKHKHFASIWLLDYPTSVEMKPLRKDPRVNVFIPAENPENRNWNILDLSRSGALIGANGQIPEAGSDVKFSFLLPSGERVEEIQAKVVRQHKGSKGKHAFGVMFHENQGSRTTLIKQYCEKYQDTCGEQ